MDMVRTIGRYQITRELGRGAMGVVYHAVDPTIGRPVAIKTLRLRDLDDAQQRSRLRERLFREARSAGALSHPGIVTIYDMDEVDGLAYIAMEFVDGEALEDLLSRPQAIDKKTLTEVLRQAAAALDYAHRKGVVHRDVKPANIMIDRSGAVKITDFGIAKLAEIEGQTLTGVLVGTPNYMSPEQVQGDVIDGRSDQFSLAVIAYEMMSGERPFAGDQISTVVYKIVNEQPPAVQSLNSSLPESSDKALRKALAKRPDRRFATCTAFATALESALGASAKWMPAARRRPAAPLSSDAVTKTFRAVGKAKAEGKPIAAPAASLGARPGSDPKNVRSAKDEKRKKSSGWLIPFLGGAVILTGILALIAWQMGWLDAQWVRDLLDVDGSSEQTEAPAPDQSPRAATPPAVASQRRSPMPAPPAPEALPPTETGPSAATQQPSSPSVSDKPVVARQQPLVDQQPPKQGVTVLTDPAGAVAALDGSGEFVCRTPCKLPAASGTHDVVVTLPGYQPERREIQIGHSDVELPLITMRAANGVLMLTSQPGGLDVTVDGKPTGYQTPLRMTLPAGHHEVSVSRGPLRSSGTVEIRNGDLTSLKLIVNSP